MPKKYTPSDYAHQYKTRSYNLDYKPGESDLEYYRRLAKAADQRLLRLEQLAGKVEGVKGTPGYEKATMYAYDRAMRDLEIYGGGKRFNTKPPLNKDGTIDNRLLHEKMADMRAFLSSVTSTKSGITQVYEQRAKTFNEQFGTSYTWMDLADFYQSGDADKALKNASSGTVQKSIGIIQHALKQAEKELKDNKKITLDKVNKDKLAYSKSIELLKSNDLDLSILKGVSKEQKQRALQIIEEKQKKLESKA